MPYGTDGYREDRGSFRIRRVEHCGYNPSEIGLEQVEGGLREKTAHTPLQDLADLILLDLLDQLSSEFTLQIHAR